MKVNFLLQPSPKMQSDLKRTYLIYSRGLMPDDLQLGSLHIDPANPVDSDENKRFRCPIGYVIPQYHLQPLTQHLCA